MTEKGLYSIARLKELQEDFGFEFKKALGQNFLIDGNIIRKIAQESGITKDTTVMEIGPGIGTLTEDAAYTERASIESNTITHAVVLELNGRPAKSWFDLPDTVLDMVARREGEMIAVGGGGVVRDMIQRAHNMNLGINLMNGPEGASTDKAAFMPEYSFEGAKGLVERLYAKRPDIFVPEFDISKVDEYVLTARKQQRSSLNIQELKDKMGIKAPVQNAAGGKRNMPVAGRIYEA